MKYVNKDGIANKKYVQKMKISLKGQKNFKKWLTKCV